MHRGFPICNPKMNTPIAFASTCLAMYYFHPRSRRASQVFTNLFSCLNYQEAIKSYQMLLQVRPRDLKICFLVHQFHTQKIGLKPLKTTTTTTTTTTAQHVEGTSQRRSGGLQRPWPKITDLFAVKDEIQWNLHESSKFLEMFDFFLWMIRESFKNHAGKFWYLTEDGLTVASLGRRSYGSKMMVQEG